MEKNQLYKVLTIAGFDGSGGAGIQADLKTFSALGCYGMTALTALPVQNTVGVKSIYDISPLCVEEQLRTILDDIQIHSLKIGMLYTQEIIEVVANVLNDYKPSHIVLDPIMLSKSGHKLLLPTAITAMKNLLFPITTVLTPNLLEASEILEREIQTKNQIEQAAIDLVETGPRAVVIKGRHSDGSYDDCLCIKNSTVKIYWLSHLKIQTNNTHGTRCTFSAAIAAFLAKGFDINEAVKHAKEYLVKSIEAGARFRIGCGSGPIHHFHHLKDFLSPNPSK